MSDTTSSDERSFKRDMLATLPSLRAFAVSLSGRADRADDLMQDAILKAWANQASAHTAVRVAADK